MTASAQNSNEPASQADKTPESSTSSANPPEAAVPVDPDWRRKRNERVTASILNALDPSNVENFRRTSTRGI